MIDKPKKYHLVSLGCPKNLVDSEVFAEILDENFYSPTDNPEEAELILVNTCGFIADAKEESINTILEMAEYKKFKCEKLVVTGCLVKRYFEDLKSSIPEIDNLINLKDFAKFSQSVFQKETNNFQNLYRNRKLLTLPHFAYIRISDGCNNHCSYCAIPAIRGNLQSVPMDFLIDEAKQLARKGVKELIVTAQDTTQYGIDIYGKPMLSELLKRFHQIENFEWIRLLYLHPAHISSELIDKIASLPKINKYFEIPLQHINNDILKSMNRRVSKEQIISIIEEIREKIPEAVIRTTFIVGYPGETEKKFEELKKFISDFKFERLGIFTYSKEENTKAFSLPNQISPKIAQKRKDELMEIQQQISREFLENLVGKTIEVIIDKKSNEQNFQLEGRTYFDAPEIDGTVFLTNNKAEVGEIAKVKIIDAWEYDLVGEII